MSGSIVHPDLLLAVRKYLVNNITGMTLDNTAVGDIREGQTGDNFAVVDSDAIDRWPLSTVPFTVLIHTKDKSAGIQYARDIHARLMDVSIAPSDVENLCSRMLEIAAEGWTYLGMTEDKYHAHSVAAYLTTVLDKVS